MTFSFTQAQKLTPTDLMENALRHYTQMQRAQYLHPQLHEALLKAQQENEMYKPNMQSQMSLRQAQTGLTNEQSKYYGPNIQSQMALRGQQGAHLGAMTEGQNIENKFKPRMFENQAREAEFYADNPLLKGKGIVNMMGSLQYMKKHPELFGNQQNKQETGYLPGQGMGLLNQEAGQEQQGGYNPMQSLEQAIQRAATGTEHKFAPSNSSKLYQEKLAIDQGVNPLTGQKFSTKKEQNEAKTFYDEQIKPLPRGQHYWYDPETGEQAGITRPLTNDERRISAGRTFFNEIANPVNKALSNYAGKDSIIRFNHDAKNYGKDKAATKRIDDFLWAKNSLTTEAINEQATLGAGKTNVTYKHLKSALDSSGIPDLVQKYEKELILPKEAFLKAGVRFNKTVNTATEKSSKSIPASKVEYYQPEKYLKTKEQKLSSGEENLDQEAMGNSGHEVLMVAPDGTEGFVPINRIKEAKAAKLKFKD